MQVTNIKDHVTHAVIAPGTVQEFGISQSAEFFQMLSSSLYSDKMLAVVRETLCNAWDAHIEAGITNIPVEVTLDNKKLVIRDFGTGIPDYKIGPTYGVYGGSTKAANENVTGGFGLGCKSPFAYNDHFETTSWSERKMTIYSMSLSSAMVGGKPSITTLLSVPTDDTGLQVSVNLKDPYDRHRFEKLIKRIARFGQMNVKLNGDPLSVLPFNEAKEGYMICKRSLFDDNTAQRIHIRYGNVVYPLELKDDYSAEYKRATEFLDQLDGPQRGYYSDKSWMLILQADPNTVSVTPSRESLSMTQHTIDTVSDLLSNFLTHTNEGLENVCLKFAEEAIQTIWTVGLPATLLTCTKQLPNLRYFMNKKKDVPLIVNLEDAGHTYLQHGANYPSAKDMGTFAQKDILARLDALVKSKFGKTGLINSFRQSLRNETFSTHQYMFKNNVLSTWLHRRMLWPLAQGLQAHKELESKRLHVVIKNPKYNSALPYSFVPFDKYHPNMVEEVMPLLRGVVIVAYNRLDVGDRVGSFPMMKNWFGETAGTLLYICPRNVAKGEAAVAFFESQGYYVVDLTKAQKWEEKEVVEPKVREAPVKKRKKGIPVLSEIVDTSSQKLNPLLAWDEEAARIENPEFVVVIGANREKVGQLTHHGREAANRHIIALYGSKGGIVTNSKQQLKYIDAGAKTLDSYLPAKMIEEYKTNPLIEQYYRNTPHGFDAKYYSHASGLTHHQDTILAFIKRDDELRKLYGFPDPLPERERHIVSIFETLDSWDLRNKTWEEATNLVVSWRPSRELKTYIDQTTSNRLIEIFSVSNLVAVADLRADSKNPHRIREAKAARDMLLTALLG